MVIVRQKGETKMERNTNYLTTIANSTLGYSNDSECLKNIVTLVKENDDDLLDISHILTKTLIQDDRKGMIAQNLLAMVITPINEFINNGQKKEAYNLYINTKLLLTQACGIKIENNLNQKVKVLR